MNEIFHVLQILMAPDKNILEFTPDKNDFLSKTRGKAEIGAS